MLSCTFSCTVGSNSSVTIYYCTQSTGNNTTHYHINAILKINHLPNDIYCVGSKVIPLYWWTCMVGGAVSWFRSYHSSSFIVVPVHGRTSVWPVFSGVCKLSGYKHSEFGVLATATPFPALTWWTFVVGITAAHGGGSFCTGPRHCKCHASWGNCMDKCGLSSG